MALTVALVARSHPGSQRKATADITFDASYATGGEELLPGAFGFSTIQKVNAEPVGGRSFPYDYTNKKLQAFGGTTEVVAATDLSAVVVRCEVFGR